MARFSKLLPALPHPSGSPPPLWSGVLLTWDHRFLLSARNHSSHLVPSSSAGRSVSGLVLTGTPPIASREPRGASLTNWSLFPVLGLEMRTGVSSLEVAGSED